MDATASQKRGRDQGPDRRDDPASHAASNHILLRDELLPVVVAGVPTDGLRFPNTIRATRLRSSFMGLPFTAMFTPVPVTEMRLPNSTVPSRKTTVSSVNGFNASSTLPGRAFSAISRGVLSVA